MNESRQVQVGYDHLNMQVGIAGYAQHYLRMLVARTLVHVPIASRALAFLIKNLTKLANTERAYRITQEYCQPQRKAGRNDAHAQSVDSGYGYESQIKELGAAEKYRQEILKGNWNTQRTESGDLYDEVLRVASGVIKSQKMTYALNFGVSYAYVDAELAKEFPETTFIGVDRSPLTRLYNDLLFDLPNLQVEAADIFELMKRQRWDGSLLMHIRTMTCLPEHFALQFYRQAAESGFDHILLAEQCGISWETGKPYEFSDEPKPSVIYRNFMHIHNYPAMLKVAGYAVSYSNLLKTRHPDPNYRIVVMMASRNT
ncbi:MAG: hypothetical protein AB7L92_02985 [Alphaproteobacteria bacterium]